ncbi:hypothetical protein DL768_005790 [Monosporascus sp. mg162]|nr:hypothetical protein DL768_005790 [Monosporascus sp. mg162]
MSHLKYYAYEKAGINKKAQFKYSQAVRINDRIECSGQGGWDPDTEVFEKEINAQIDLAFANVERCLKDAGGKGWSQVFRVNSYHVPINNEAMAAMVRNFKKYMPDHEPIWTCVGVTRLGEDDMRVEIEVVAHDPAGAKAAECRSVASQISTWLISKKSNGQLMFPVAFDILPTREVCLSRVPGMSATTGQGSISRSYARLLQARIKLLEEVLQSHSINIDGSVSRLSARSVEPLDGPSSAAFTTSSAFDQLCSTFEGALCFDEVSNFDQDGEARFFGPTSGRLEFKDSTSTSELCAPCSEDSTAAQKEPTRRRFEVALRDISQQRDIIPDEVVEHLIDLYFEWEQPWCQVVDEQLFRQSRQTGGRFFSPLLLNCILALGSRYSDKADVRTDPDDPNTAGYTFLDIAEILLHFDLKWPSITTIQSLAVMAIVYVNAQGVVSLPSVPAAIRQPEVSQSHSGRLTSAHTAALLQRALCTQCQILEKIMHNLYAPRRLIHEAETRSFFDSCRLTLKGWFYDLAPELSLDRGSAAGPRTTSPHVYILHMVYHTSVILLATPFLPKPPPSNPGVSGERPRTMDERTHQAYSLCVQAVTEICQLGERYREMFGTFRKGPLTVTHCTLTAALATLRLSRDEEESISDEREKLVLSCIQTLQELSDSWTPSRRYWPVVSKMVLERQGAKTGEPNEIGDGPDLEFFQIQSTPNPADMIYAPPPGDGSAFTTQTAASPSVDRAPGFIEATAVPKNVTSQEPVTRADVYDSQLMSDVPYWPEFPLHPGSDLLPWDYTDLEPQGGLEGSWGQVLSWPPL